MLHAAAGALEAGAPAAASGIAADCTQCHCQAGSSRCTGSRCAGSRLHWQQTALAADCTGSSRCTDTCTGSRLHGQLIAVTALAAPCSRSSRCTGCWQLCCPLPDHLIDLYSALLWCDSLHCPCAAVLRCGCRPVLEVLECHLPALGVRCWQRASSAERKQHQLKRLQRHHQGHPWPAQRLRNAAATWGPWIVQGALVSKLCVQNAASRSADFRSLFITVNAALGVHMHRPLIAKRAFQWFLNGLKQPEHMNTSTSNVDSGWHLLHVAFKWRLTFSHRFLAA